MSDFFNDIYDVVLLIPSGKVTSYGAIANYLGSKGSARIVGWAMNQVPKNSNIPAHRVVNRNGCLTGRHHFNPPEKMQQLLENEGITVSNHCIENFNTCFWDPSLELNL